MATARNMFEVFKSRVATSGDRIALKKKVDGQWRAVTWNQWAQTSKNFSLALMATGMKAGDRVAILSNSRAEWVESDFGIIGAGGITVPIYQSNTPDQCEYILNDSESRYVVAEDAAQLAKLQKIRGNLKSVEKVILVSGTVGNGVDAAWVVGYADFLNRGAEYGVAHSAEFEARTSAIKPGDPITFVYTSGTTGPPKGVVLTHANFVFECDAVNQALTLGEDDEQVLFLPLAHIFAKILVFASIQTGSMIAFAESIEKLIDNVGEIRPTFLASVPRIYEKVYGKVKGDVETAGGLKKKIFDWAVKVGREVSVMKQRGDLPTGWLAFKYKIATKLVFSKLQARFGGNLKFFVSGGAPLSREIAEFFHAAGLLILEGFGLTETTAASHVNRLDMYRFGSVGPALPGVDCKIAEDGEVLLRGPNIMREYYKKPDDTRACLTPDGWFHTGDIGVIDKSGILTITDRKKDLIVTAGGKNVAPQNIENALKTSRFVSQVMVHGDKRNYLTALITLNEENVKAWAAHQGISAGSFAELSQRPEVRALLQGVIEEKNRELASYESIKKFVILDHDLAQDTGELTPTLKVKRKFTTEKYQTLLDQMYA
ncbi:MAG: AMP-binding protein [Deltaproteobacteria bacterium]|nr:AMP-binding protein [Deltaproteobacteria bacterium]